MSLDALPIPAPILTLPPTPRPPLPTFPELPPLPQPEPARDYVRPTHAERFRCISSACEDNCCQGWSVPIDRATYEKYRGMETMRPHLGVLIQLNTNKPTAADYARMPLTATGVCSFLHPDKLCGIQKRHGADALSVTCATYPRAASQPGGVAEEALNLSCPEAARVTLLEPNMLTGWYWPPQGPGRYAAIAYAGDQPIARSSVRLAIREFILALVGDRSYPLWQRMILLGNLTRRLQALSGEATVAEWADSNPAAVAHLLADSANSAATHRLQPLLDDFQPQPGPQLQFVMQVLRGRMSQPPISNRFRECVADCESGLGCATATSEQEILDNYNRAYRLYYQPLMERNPHILENYLMNYVFKNGFPFLRHAAVHADARVDAETEHLLLCVFTALTQTLLIGMAGHYAEAFDLTHVVKLVQTLARTFEHSLQAMNEIAVLVHAQGLNNLRGIALMLQP